MIEIDNIYNMDCIEGMKLMANGSVDAVIADLPYGVLNRSNKAVHWDRQIPLEALWEQYRRITKPGSPVILFAQGIFSARLMLSQPRMWRYNLVWRKDRVTGHLNANRMPLRQHEDIIVFYDRQPVYHPQMMPCPPAERAANNPWPEWPKVLKTDYGQEEAIACFGTDPRIYQTTVKEFHKDKNGRLNGLTIVRLESKVDEKTGRRNMVEVSGSEKKIPAELVLIAAGFLGTEEYIAKAFGVELNQRTNVATEPGTYATNVKNVFVAGDMHRGQSLVVWAIREGREVAHDVDTSLMGYSYLSVQ